MPHGFIGHPMMAGIAVRYVGVSGVCGSATAAELLLNVIISLCGGSPADWPCGSLPGRYVPLTRRMLSRHC